jgi:hypothetical protein
LPSPLEDAVLAAAARAASGPKVKCYDIVVRDAVQMRCNDGGAADFEVPRDSFHALGLYDRPLYLVIADGKVYAP